MIQRLRKRGHKSSLRFFRDTQKRGLSTIVATVLIVLVTLTAITFLWLGIYNIVKVDTSFFDTTIEIVTKEGFTFYDENDQSLTVQVRVNGEDPAAFVQINIELQDGTVLSSVHDAPQLNSKARYFLTFDLVETIGNPPIKIFAAPIFVIDEQAYLGRNNLPIDVPKRVEEYTFYSGYVKRFPTHSYAGSGGGQSGSQGGGGAKTEGNTGCSYTTAGCDFALGCFGDESPTDGVFEICTCEDLHFMHFQENLDKDYILMGDIDCVDTRNSGASVWGDEGFDPIGTSANPFTGTLDGNFKVISNLYINRPATSDVGLFGNIYEFNPSGPTIENVGLDNVEIYGFDNVGGLIGLCSECILANSFVRTHTNGINGVNEVGGLIGEGVQSGADNIDIIDSYTSGFISGVNEVGGLIGHATDGGSGSTKDEIEDSYSTAIVVASGGTDGGLYGGGEDCFGGSCADISESFYDGQVNVCGGTCDWPEGTQTTFNLQSTAFLEVTHGWDFTNTWEIQPNEYPTLQGFG